VTEPSVALAVLERLGLTSEVPRSVRARDPTWDLEDAEEAEG
jgi:hypothetical protein